jgi:hypothetical protein
MRLIWFGDGGIGLSCWCGIDGTFLDVIELERSVFEVEKM